MNSHLFSYVLCSHLLQEERYKEHRSAQGQTWTRTLTCCLDISWSEDDVEQVPCVMILLLLGLCKWLQMLSFLVFITLERQPVTS